jgi:hypothetical protein
MTSTEIIAKIAIPAGYEKPAIDANIDGNAFSIISAVSKALRENKEVQSRFNKYIHESESYDCLLQVCMSVVDFDFEGEDGLMEDEDTEW